MGPARVHVGDMCTRRGLRAVFGSASTVTYPHPVHSPLVSTSWSLGSRSTLYSVVMPLLATIVLSDPWVNTTTRARVPEAFGKAGTDRTKGRQRPTRFDVRRTCKNHTVGRLVQYTISYVHPRLNEGGDVFMQCTWVRQKWQLPTSLRQSFAANANRPRATSLATKLEKKN